MLRHLCFVICVLMKLERKESEDARTLSCSVALAQGTGPGQEALSELRRGTDPVGTSFLFCDGVAMCFWGQHILFSGFSFCIYKMYILIVPISLGCLRIQEVIHVKYFIYLSSAQLLCTCCMLMQFEALGIHQGSKCVFSLEKGDGKEKKINNVCKYNE